ncbi:hypothetical protein T12_10466 [Trichinella patagoniensis]|uniref:Uncharacterized protein n=3 Tax=Trichinella TaxID=6333 RepID=A0A0V0YWB9_9BILA|nr:hypothetical protein T09_5007 [Trichinella sp. T9]KRX35141.1 hypothetical protein T09_8132 [Trichinella sp. T9]KRY02950.1 hypothetical protein T12_10517 [Trichinella patagoniensis]KRY04558.1 hypothetical protein T12_10466 [Trichinella patagoniensis]
MPLMDKQYARSVKSGLSEMKIIVKMNSYLVSKESHLPRFISCSASCRP